LGMALVYPPASCIAPLLSTLVKAYPSPGLHCSSLYRRVSRFQPEPEGSVVRVCEVGIGLSLERGDLSGANLHLARITKEQLGQVESLRGATMPNGQKYEDWLKSKGSSEGGENGVPS
jgi:hypothetical protein